VPAIVTRAPTLAVFKKSRRVGRGMREVLSRNGGLASRERERPELWPFTIAAPRRPRQENIRVRSERRGLSPPKSKTAGINPAARFMGSVLRSLDQPEGPGPADQVGVPVDVERAAAVDLHVVADVLRPEHILAAVAAH